MTCATGPSSHSDGDSRTGTTLRAVMAQKRPFRSWWPHVGRQYEAYLGCPPSSPIHTGWLRASSAHRHSCTHTGSRGSCPTLLLWKQLIQTKNTAAKIKLVNSREFPDPIHHTAAQTLELLQWRKKHAGASWWEWKNWELSISSSWEQSRNRSPTLFVNKMHEQVWKSPVIHTQSQPIKAINAISLKSFCKQWNKF